MDFCLCAKAMAGMSQDLVVDNISVAPSLPPISEKLIKLDMRRALSAVTLWRYITLLTRLLYLSLPEVNKLLFG